MATHPKKARRRPKLEEFAYDQSPRVVPAPLPPKQVTVGPPQINGRLATPDEASAQARAYADSLRATCITLSINPDNTEPNGE